MMIYISLITCLDDKMTRYSLYLLTLLLLLSSMAFEIEPWYANLKHFGATQNSGWTTHDMILVDDYTYVWRNASLYAQQEFLVVNELKPPYPPLGSLDFKEGKIGIIGQNKAQPGGGPGTISNTGNFDITIFTDSHPTKPLTFEMTPLSAVYPSVHVSTELSVVVDSKPMVATIVFSESVSNFQCSSIKVTHGSVNCSTFRSSVSGWNYTVEVDGAGTGVTTLDVPEGSAVAIASPHLPCSAAPSWQILYTDNALTKGKWGNLVTLRDPIPG